MFKIGDRVRFVHREAYGIITSDVFKSPMDGGPRQNVRWEKSGNENAWNPAFLRPGDTAIASDPETVVDGELISRRESTVTILPGGMTIVEPAGLSKK